MSIVNAVPLLEAAGGDYQISRSVRLRSSASAYLNRTFSGAPTSTTKQTFSFWLKRGSITSTARQTVFTGYDGSSTNNMWISIEPSDMLYVASGGTLAYDVSTTQVFRDPSAWYHFVIAFDTTQATASNRVKIYINGSQVTSLASSNYPPQNQALQFGLANANNKIGTWWQNTINFLDGYLTEVNFIDGQALTPSSFGQNDSVTGVWKPKKYAGTYGTNGFYLNFSDPSAATASAIGKDYSGNGNNWTPNNISVTAGVTYDSMLDVPTPYADGGNGRGNYAVLNPLVTGGGTISNANLGWTGSAGSTFAHSGFGLSSGKWYCEMTVAAVGSTIGLGVYSASAIGTSNGTKSRGYLSTGVKYSNGTTAAYGASYTTNDVIGMTVDVDAGTVEFFKNNTSQGVAYSDLASDLWFVTVQGGGSPAANINFGQRPFAFTPPTGYKALNTQNLPDSTIKKGNQYFDASLYTGTNASLAVTNGGFTPDLVWMKRRSTAASSNLIDSVRGLKKGLVSDLTNAEGTATAGSGLLSLDVSGFTIGTEYDGGSGSTNASGQTYAAWQWKKGATQGFDIVTYTGNGSTQNISHSLGVAPKMVIVKGRGNALDWIVGHNSLTSWGYTLNLDNTIAQTAYTGFNNTAPTSSVFSVGAQNATNQSGIGFVAYLFAEVAGFSKFGSYTGNGSADGPFVFLGFRPRYILIKRTDTAGNSWEIKDTARDAYNAGVNALYAESSTAEGTGRDMDYLANGFKVRNTSGDNNASGGTYIFAAFAENPFKNSLAR